MRIAFATQGHTRERKKEEERKRGKEEGHQHFFLTRVVVLQSAVTVGSGGVAISGSCMLTMRTMCGVGLRPPEKDTGICCCVNSSQVVLTAGRLAGPGPPSEPNISCVLELGGVEVEVESGRENGMAAEQLFQYSSEYVSSGRCFKNLTLTSVRPLHNLYRQIDNTIGTRPL